MSPFFIQGAEKTYLRDQRELQEVLSPDEQIGTLPLTGAAGEAAKCVLCFCIVSPPPLPQILGGKQLHSPLHNEYLAQNTCAVNIC